MRLNALTSALGGLICVTVGGWTSTVLGTGHAGLVRLVGLGLVLFSLSVAVVASARVSRLVRWAPIVSAADACWVAASAVTAAVGWYSGIGIVVVGAVAAMVGSFGVLQFRAWRQLRNAAVSLPVAASTYDEVPPIEVAHVERKVLAVINHFPV